MGQLREPLHQVLDSPEEPRGLTLEAVNRCGRTIDCHLTLSSLRADRAGTVG